MDPNLYFDLVKKCGWFDHYSEELTNKIKEDIITRHLDEEMSSDDENDIPCWGLSLISGDADGVWEENNYTEYFINQLTRNSLGLFSPYNVVEKWRNDDSLEDDEFIVEVSFLNNNKSYNIEFVHGGGWVNKVFFTLLNQAMQDINPNLCLIEIYSNGTDFYFGYTSLGAYIKTYKQGLLKKWAHDPFNWPFPIDDHHMENHPLDLPSYINMQNKNKSSASGNLFSYIKCMIKK